MERRRLVDTSSSARPPRDATDVRWRQHPVLAGVIRAVVIAAPVLAAAAAGVAASRIWRPHGVGETLGWLLMTGAVAVAVLALADSVARRLLPLHRLLQLCLVFPDRAPSRLRLAVRAARRRRPELLATDATAPPDAATAAAQIVELLAALAVHDRRTRGHSERVCAYTSLLAEQLNLPQDDRDRLMWVALIHDIGKLQVPSRLLNKPARPTVPEWQVLQAHPEHGHSITQPLQDWLGPWGATVLQHHERYDGAGYPHGLVGDEICLGARIVAVTDAFEVMTAPRPYRRPVDPQSARSELARHAGTQFDPELVRQFLAVGLPQLRRSMGLVAWVAQIPFLRSWPQLQSAAGATATQATAATAAAATAGMLLGSPVPATPHGAHEVSAAPDSPTVLHLEPPATSPGGPVAATVTDAAASTPLHHPASRRAHPRAVPSAPSAATTGSAAGGGSVSPARASAPASQPAPAASAPAPAPPAPSPDGSATSSCAHHPPAHSNAGGRGHHYGWARHPDRHGSGCD